MICAPRKFVGFRGVSKIQRVPVEYRSFDNPGPLLQVILPRVVELRARNDLQFLQQTPVGAGCARDNQQPSKQQARINLVKNAGCINQ